MMVLVTGGSGSGKSAYAEERILEMGKGRRIYIATMYPFDIESHKRVDRHRRMRAGKKFETVECYTNLEDLYLPSDGIVLLECMSNLTANEMFGSDQTSEEVAEKIIRGINKIRAQVKDFVIVTNEIFSEAVDYQGETREYQRVLGKINREIAKKADQVVEVVFGIPVVHKGLETMSYE